MQTDGGQAGDAPDARASARLLPGPGRYTGLLVTLDDAADTYALDVGRDTFLRVDVSGDGPVNVTVFTPDGKPIGGGATVKVYTDQAGLWSMRVTTTLFSRYTMDVARTPYAQDDGGTHQDAGWRPASAQPLAREGTIGNLTGLYADCADVWTLPVTKDEALVVRYEWLDGSSPGILLTWSMPGTVGFPTATTASKWRSVTATAAVNTTWTFTVRYPVDVTNGCASAHAEYHASVGPAVPPPPPPLPACSNGLDDDNDTFVDFPLDAGCADALDDDETEAPPPPPPPPPPMPEIFAVLPNVTRPGREIQVYGANFSGATFELGGLPVTVKRFDSLGLVYLTVPLLAPGRHDLFVTLDGRSDTLTNATEVLAPADLAVVAVTTRPPPDAAVSIDVPSAAREIHVTVANLAVNDSEAYTLEVFILGRGQPGLGGLALVGSLDEPPLVGLTERTRTVTWDARAAAGSYDIVATLRARTNAVPYSVVEVDASNDRGTGSDWTWADPGVGVRVDA